MRHRMARRRKEWLRTARLALLRGGPDEVRVERLARDLRVTKGSFYWHFKDREELLAKLWENFTSNGKSVDHKFWFSDTYVRTPSGWYHVAILGRCSRLGARCLINAQTGQDSQCPVTPLIGS